MREACYRWGARITPCGGLARLVTDSAGRMHARLWQPRPCFIHLPARTISAAFSMLTTPSVTTDPPAGPSARASPTCLRSSALRPGTAPRSRRSCATGWRPSRPPAPAISSCPCCRWACCAGLQMLLGTAGTAWLPCTCMCLLLLSGHIHSSHEPLRRSVTGACALAGGSLLQRAPSATVGGGLQPLCSTHGGHRFGGESWGQGAL